MILLISLHLAPEGNIWRLYLFLLHRWLSPSQFPIRSVVTKMGILQESPSTLPRLPMDSEVARFSDCEPRRKPPVLPSFLAHLDIHHLHHDTPCRLIHALKATKMLQRGPWMPLSVPQIRKFQHSIPSPQKITESFTMDFPNPIKVKTPNHYQQIIPFSVHCFSLV